MKVINCTQGSEEWFKARQLKMTASHAQAIASQGKGLESYVNELIADYLSTAEKEHYSNEHTQRGNELEPEARTVYEMETSNFVEEVGFIEHNEYSGCSPDGLIGDNGGLEIKCPSDKVYVNYLLIDKIPTDYMWQIQMNLLITGRKWWDYMIYNPNFEQDNVITRVEPDEEKLKKLKAGLEKGEQIIKERLNKIKSLKKACN